MWNPPQTAQQAGAIRYGERDSFRRGTPWQADRCAYEVSVPPWYIDQHQCRRKPGHGPGALYCKQHALMVTPAQGKE
jgi:hypothetical protein